MNKRRSRYVPGAAFASEILEKREVLSTTGSGAAAEVAGSVATKTTFKVSAGTLAQPVTLTATVKAAASRSAPTGTMDILSDGQVIGTLALKSAKGGKGATSQVKSMMTFTPGGARPLLRAAPAHRRVRPHRQLRVQLRDQHVQREAGPLQDPFRRCEGGDRHARLEARRSSRGSRHR